MSYAPIRGRGERIDNRFDPLESKIQDLEKCSIVISKEIKNIMDGMAFGTPSVPSPDIQMLCTVYELQNKVKKLEADNDAYHELSRLLYSVLPEDTKQLLSGASIFCQLSPELRQQLIDAAVLCQLSEPSKNPTHDTNPNP